jgi:hypothetical protein
MDITSLPYLRTLIIMKESVKNVKDSVGKENKVAFPLQLDYYIMPFSTMGFGCDWRDQS